MVHPFVLHLIDGSVYQLNDLLEVAAVGYTIVDNGQYIAVVTGQILIVLAKELRVLESDNTTVDV